MARSLLLFLLVALATAGLRAQVSFKTLVTPGPVVVGEPFQVQYVLENIEENDEFIPPSFKYFQFVSGPNIYMGSITTNGHTRNLRNMIYTLVAKKPGKFMIPGAGARVNGKLLHSDNAAIEVISKKEAMNRGFGDSGPIPEQEYYLRPGEDPQAKIRRNLFLKVLVDRKSCYVGQPVTATFKLYSRLQSRSDIVKNPGFYGFTVHDIISLNDRHIEREVINGKKFDVHTIRKVQLYPLQAGVYTIDPMELQNRVEFSKTAIRKQTEQEIMEGIFDDPDVFSDPNTVSYENSMHTEPVKIEVKPVPAVNKPVDFNGATGKFSISASLTKPDIRENEESELQVQISGNGNFTQLISPVIQWPAGIEGYEPEVSDSLDYGNSPMKGQRTFRYRMIATRAGHFNIPGIGFSFFDPDSNRYRTISTGNLTLAVNPELKGTFIKDTIAKIKSPGKESSNRKWMIIVGSILVLMISLFLLRRKRSGRPKVEELKQVLVLPSIQEILHKPSVFSQSDPATFCTALRSAIWQFFQSYGNLDGTKMNKQDLSAWMKEKNIPAASQKAMLDILEICETSIFTRIDQQEDQVVTLEKTRDLLERIRKDVA